MNSKYQHPLSALPVSLLASLTLIFLSSTWFTIKYKKAIWQLESGYLWFLALLGLAYLTSSINLNIKSRKYSRVTFLQIVIITFSVFGSYILLLHLFGPGRLGITELPRSILIVAVFLALFLPLFSRFLGNLKLESGFLCLALISSVGLNTAYQLDVLPMNKSNVSVQYVPSTLYDLEVTKFKHPVPKPASNGGALSILQGKYLLATGDGSLYSFDRPKGKGSLNLRKLDIQIPINHREFKQDTAGKAQHSNFRVTDLATLEDDTGRYIIAAHHHWFHKEQCYVLRGSRLLLNDISTASVKWETLFETAPCLKLKNYVRGQSFAGEESGGRLALTGNNKLLLTVGDHEHEGWNSEKILAQDDASDYGKIHEIDLQSGKSRIISKGHRNPQGLYIDTEGTIWSTEHGPEGGDELNQISDNENYGWPFVTYGVDYGKKLWPLSTRQGSHNGYERPVYSWVPGIGISNLVGIEQNAFDLWKGDLIISSLKDGSLWRARIHKKRLVVNERIDIGTRIRDVIEGNKGELIIWSDELPEIIFIEPIEGEITGEIMFAKCVTCHSVGKPDSNKPGPDLAKIVGKEIASQDGYNYSQAMSALSGKWTREKLGLFLKDPNAFVPGTSMRFEGIKNEDRRNTLVRYLEKL